jgi:hypothetical protein
MKMIMMVVRIRKVHMLPPMGLTQIGTLILVKPITLQEN